jgi:hypothetical protein
VLGSIIGPSMPKYRALPAALLALLVVACRSASEAPPPSAEPAPSAAPQRSAKQFGQPIGAGEKVVLSDVLKAPKSFENKPVIVEGAVRQACTRKGCWMEIADGMDKALPGCRVTFKDYGFFVPTDSAGTKARVQGNVVVQTVQANWVSHMEEEGAHFASKNPDGSANEVRLVATGVELTK